MDTSGEIYELTEEQKTNPDPQVREDVGRLDGFIKGRNFLRNKIKNEKVIWDSQRLGTYRKSEYGSIGKEKENQMGIEGIEELAPEPIFEPSQSENEPEYSSDSSVEPGPSGELVKVNPGLSDESTE